ncbi:hypothetical protein FQA39_LY01714 [Lamprigera yunnana]|nr:hypothetical protein FQA39_LY01714 [Lamprigera yunnana]
MSWFDAAGLASIAKTALKEAQRTIDKALDIREDAAPAAPINTPVDADDFFTSWGISESGNIQDIKEDVVAKPNKMSTSIWGSFTGSFFDAARDVKPRGSVESLDDSIEIGDDGFSRSKLVVQHSDDGETNLFTNVLSPLDEETVNIKLAEFNTEEFPVTVRKQQLRVDANRLSLISVESSKTSSESVEIVSGGTGCTTSPESDLHSVEKSTSTSSSIGLRISESVEVLADSLTSPSSVEILPTESDYNYSDEFVSPLASPIVEHKRSPDSVEVIHDLDEGSLAEDSISYASFSESTSNTLLEPNVKPPITRGPSRSTMHLSLALIDTQPQSVNVSNFECSNIIDIPQVFYETQAEDEGSQSDRTVIASDNVMESSSDTSTTTESNTNSFYLANMLADAMTDPSKDLSHKSNELLESVTIPQLEMPPRDNSPLSSESRSDMVKIGSDETSGHTSGDENETTTSSDIEIISSPNGDSSSTQSRHSPAKVSCIKHKVSDANVDALLGKMTYMKIRGHNRELSEASSISDDSHSSEIDRLLKRISEMTEILELREVKLIDFNRRNAELQEINNNLQHQLDIVLTKQVETADLSQVTEEYTQRMSALEKKFQQAIRDKDILRKQLEQSKQEAAARMSKNELDTLLSEKDEIINELREEGEKLSKQQLQHCNIIKKLRAKEKEHETTIKNLKDNLEEFTSEADRLKRSLTSKEEIERVQIEAVHQLTSKNTKLEFDGTQLQSQLDDITQKYETVKKSLDAAKKELVGKNKTSSELYMREQKLQSLENEKRMTESQNEEIINQLEDMRQKLHNADEEYLRKEQNLRHENNNLLRRLEDAERRNEELAQSVSEISKPIIRQLETLQATHNTKLATFETVEKKLMLKISEMQGKYQTASDAERLAREECLNMRSKLSSLETQMNATMHQNEMLKIDVEQEKAVKIIQEQELKGQIAVLQQSMINEEEKHKGLQREVFALEQQLSIEKTALEAEKRKYLILQDQMRTGCAAESSRQSPTTRDTSPTLSLGRLSLSESLGSSVWPLEEAPDLSPAPRFTNMFELQMLQSNLKQRDGEVQQLQWELNRREHEKNLISGEISKLLTKVEELEEESKKLKSLQSEFRELQQQYDLLCQLYGEKVEENEELKLDLLDVKELYKAQLDELLQQQKDSVSQPKQVEGQQQTHTLDRSSQAHNEASSSTTQDFKALQKLPEQRPPQQGAQQGTQTYQQQQLPTQHAQNLQLQSRPQSVQHQQQLPTQQGAQMYQQQQQFAQSFQNLKVQSRPTIQQNRQMPQQQLSTQQAPNQQLQPRPTIRQDAQMYQQQHLPTQYAQNLQLQQRPTAQQNAQMHQQQLLTQQAPNPLQGAQMYQEQQLLAQNLQNIELQQQLTAQQSAQMRQQQLPTQKGAQMYQQQQLLAQNLKNIEVQQRLTAQQTAQMHQQQLLTQQALNPLQGSQMYQQQQLLAQNLQNIELQQQLTAQQSAQMRQQQLPTQKGAQMYQQQQLLAQNLKNIEVQQRLTAQQTAQMHQQQALNPLQGSQMYQQQQLLAQNLQNIELQQQLTAQESAQMRQQQLPTQKGAEMYQQQQLLAHNLKNIELQQRLTAEQSVQMRQQQLPTQQTLNPQEGAQMHQQQQFALLLQNIKLQPRQTAQQRTQMLQQQLSTQQAPNPQLQPRPTIRQDAQMYQQQQLPTQQVPKDQLQPQPIFRQGPQMPQQQLSTHQVQSSQGHAQTPQILPTSQPQVQVQDTSTPQVKHPKDSYFQKKQGKTKGKTSAIVKAVGETAKSSSSTQISVTIPEIKTDTNPQLHTQQDDSAKSTGLDLIIPQRQKLQSGGTQGRKITIETNHLELKVKTTKAVHYDVSLDPDKPKKLLKSAMEEFRKKYYPERYPAFDNVKNLYSSSLLPFGQEITGEVTVPDEDRKKTFKIKIKFVNDVDLSSLAKYIGATASRNDHKVTPQEAVQCLDIVLRNAPSLSCIPVGRSLFIKPTGRILDLKEGMEAYRGFYQSAVLGWKLFLNIDVVHKPFPKNMPVLDLISEITTRHYDYRRDRLQNENYDVVRKFLERLKVHYEIPNQPGTKRIYNVNELHKTATEYSFTNDENVKMTIEEYYRKIKCAPLRYPHLPCLWVGNKQRNPPILLPPEFCTVVGGQVTNRKMTQNQTSNLIKIAATSTDVRKKNIMEFVSRANHNNDMCAREFGISVKPEFTKVPARVLHPPVLKYSNNTVKPNKGVWQSGKFDEAQPLNDWCIVCLDNRTNRMLLEDFSSLVVKEGSSLGMTITRPKGIIPLTLQWKAEKKILEEQFKKLKSMQLIVVVIPDYKKEIYSYVKQVAELTVGVVTQCVKAKNVEQKCSSTIRNILLKINAKLNGRNHILGVMPNCLRSSPCIIMGADVTHPSPDNKSSTPSVAAITASHDVYAFQYNITWRLQPPTQEIITDLANVVHEHLLFYKKKNNVSPHRIIFFRDGVSEGQFEIVVNQEVRAIYQACAKLEPGKVYKPKITFLVVQKRHHTRFFPTDKRDSEDRNFNVPPGTVVDTEITHPTALDFYLVSHASIQGVARPTKYRKLWDDNDMNEDELEELTYHLCHLFTRCTRSVSYPAPTYYAHLAAARAKREDQQVTLPTPPSSDQSSPAHHGASPSTSRDSQAPQKLPEHPSQQRAQQDAQMYQQQLPTQFAQNLQLQSQPTAWKGAQMHQKQVPNPQWQPRQTVRQEATQMYRQQQSPTQHASNVQRQPQPTAWRGVQTHQRQVPDPQLQPRPTLRQDAQMYQQQQFPTHQVQYSQGHAQTPQMLSTSQPSTPTPWVQAQDISAPQVKHQKDSYFQKKQGKKKGKTPATVKAVGETAKSSSSTQISVTTSEMKIDTQPQLQTQLDDSAKSTALDLMVPQRQKLQSGGTKGRKIIIETNHLALMLKATKAVHYDVSLDPNKPKKFLKIAMEQFRRKYYPERYPAFDNVKNLYSSSLLPFGEEITGEVTVPDEDRQKTYKIKIKFANYVDLSSLAKYIGATASRNDHKVTPQEAVQCLDIVLRNAPSLSCIPVGRSLFIKPKGGILDLGEGMESYRGFYQSAVLGWKLFLNIDVVHKPFPKNMPVLDLISEITTRHYDYRRDRLQNENYDVVRKFLEGLRVHYEIPNQPATKRIYNVNQLHKTATEYRFTTDQNVMMTVEEYYRKNKRVTLKYPHLPCLWVGNKQRESPILIPLEFCTIVEGQVTNRKMTPIQTANLIKIAATSTDVRKKNIMEFVSRANHNNDMCAREFGISVNPEFTKVPARVLDPPVLKYSNNTVKPSRGVWRSGKFDDASPLNDWFIVCVDDRTNRGTLENFTREVIKEGSILGMTITRPKDIISLTLRWKAEKKILEEQFLKLKSMQLVLVVIPDFKKEIYSYVKQVAELTVGVVTQCVKAKNVFQMRSSTISNILLKINAKLNGRNHQLGVLPNCLKSPCIIMGADVTHPSADSKSSTPSVAAITASHDIYAFQYNITWRLQPPTQEIITDLANVVHEHLLFYKKKNNVTPQRIIFFRDGVSEGQFEIVVNKEVRAIYQACAKLEPGKVYKPKITFLVVQKRHHTRFFPTDKRDSEDRNFNVPPGTVVDTEITHPTALDFYLVSHASIQGVARPTKYRKLWDDNDMNEDELEELTYHLCHLFTRCTRSVSYPAPTYYAHLAAARAKVYCERREINMSNLEREQSQLVIREEVVKKFPMFFV